MSTCRFCLNKLAVSAPAPDPTGWWQSHPASIVPHTHTHNVTTSPGPIVPWPDRDSSAVSVANAERHPVADPSSHFTLGRKLVSDRRLDSFTNNTSVRDRNLLPQQGKSNVQYKRGDRELESTLLDDLGHHRQQILRSFPPSLFNRQMGAATPLAFHSFLFIPN